MSGHGVGSRHLRTNSRESAAVVRVLRRRICGYAGARSSADHRTGAGEALARAANAEAECCPPVAGAGGWVVWQARYYDFNVWTEAKRIEKLLYIHRNPVVRGLVASPELWDWSSFRHYASGYDGVVEIESQWTARKRELLGGTPQLKAQSQNPRPVPAKDAGTRTGQPL